MSYVNRDIPDDVWQSWVDDNLHHFKFIGLPKIYYSSKEFWSDFCVHGILHRNNGEIFEIMNLSPEQAMRLVHVFQCELTGSWYYETSVRQLAEVLKIDNKQLNDEMKRKWHQMNDDI
jgi:hypothetical protein